MKIQTFLLQQIPAAAALFAAHYATQRQANPLLSEAMQDPAWAAGLLAELFASGSGLAALEDGQLVGYLGWWEIANLRRAERKAAYTPEWGHAAAGGPGRIATYQALYRAASARWVAAGCQVFALTFLADDPELERFWFWNGYGLHVIDSLRPITPLGLSLPAGVQVRQATPEDAEKLAALDREHRQHYSQPPVLMAQQEPGSAGSFRAFLSRPPNSAWLAFCDGDLAGFMRAEAHSFGAADVLQTPGTIAITAAYTRPAYRGRGAAPAVLDAILQHYAGLGFTRCAVDFESINPEASHLWMKYVTPVCYSVLRMPEMASSEMPG
jgi:GNAT superfamily N-acetyltransferase